MELLEIRWHGRGGQGVVTAAKFLTDIALSENKFFQAFPEYGPERMGAPIQAFTRISKKPINVRSAVRSPNVVVVMDSTLIGTVNVIDGIKDDAVVVVNTSDEPDEVRKTLGIENKSVKIFTVNATQISLETLGRPIPNTPMIGALTKALQFAEIEKILEFLKKTFSKKFSDEIVEANVQAALRAYQEVREG